MPGAFECGAERVAGGIIKVYIIRKSVDKLKAELLFASTHHVRAGGKPVKFAEDGFRTSASLHSRQ